MRPAPAKFACLLLFCGCAVPLQASAQYDVEKEEEDRAWIRSLLDVRLARGGPAPAWTDHGPGKTRYGGRIDGAGFERVTRFALAQLAIEAGAILPWDVRAQAQVNVQPDIAEGYTPWLVEALLRREWGEDASGWGLQAGVMTIPFSLEHVGAAWTPELTISASALNTWLWEEFSLAGFEGEWWRETQNGLRMGVLAGLGFGPDTFGRLIALRGWTLGDGIGGMNGHLALPNGTHTDIFDERDDRPAAYALVTLGDAGERATFKLGYLDNMGDQDEPGVWHTRIHTAGVTLRLPARLDFVAQYLDGKARVRTPANDSELRAFYATLSHRRGPHCLSVRYDEFRVEDLDGGNPTSERGDGVTAAYFHEWGLRHRIGLEHTWLDSRRPQGAADELASDGWQLSYRFRY